MAGMEVSPRRFRLKIMFEKEKHITKKIIEDKKGKILRKKVLENGDDSGKSLWKAVKESLNWKEGGPPMELKNKEGKLECRLSKVCDIFHEAMEDKVNKIAKDMKEYEVTEAEEKKAVQEAGI